jgi:hypothetical protein
MRAGSCIIFIIFLFSGCYYDSQEYLFPTINTTCDTSNVTFSGSVQPILNNHCFGCHSNTTFGNGGNIKLEDYGDVVTHADRLVGSLLHQSGYSPMPKPLGTPKLDDCTISVISIWVTTGTPQN